MSDYEHPHFLRIRLAGKEIGPGRIPITHLLHLLSQFNKALHRIGMVLLGHADSLRRGPMQKSVKDEIALDLVEFTHGSPATVLGMERSGDQQAFQGMDFGLEIFEKALEGLEIVQQRGEELPAGYDSGVLLAWRDLGSLFHRGIEEVRFTLNHRQRSMDAVYEPTGYRRIQERIQGPQINIRTIEGRLLMADFQEHGTRCRIHPSMGDPVFCLFDESRKDEVLDNILRYVKVLGEAKEDPVTGKIISIILHDIERMEDREQERVDLLPQGTPVPTDFWQSLSIEELAQSQGVNPLVDVNALFGTWPGEDNDGFEEAVLTLRRQTMAGIGPQ